MRTTTLALPVALLAACVSSERQSQVGKDDVQEAAMSDSGFCVPHSSIKSIEPLDDRQIVLYEAGERKAYLAEMEAGCFNIEMQTMFAAVDGDTNGQICGQGRDSVTYRRFNSVEDCRIVGLEELSDERRRELGVVAPQEKSRN
jgi:hypothetical protein